MKYLHGFFIELMYPHLCHMGLEKQGFIELISQELLNLLQMAILIIVFFLFILHSMSLKYSHFLGWSSLSFGDFINCFQI